MIAEKDFHENGGTRSVASQEDGGDSESLRGQAGAAPSNQVPSSRKIYVDGFLNPGVRVPFREISLVPTKSMDGKIEVNEPVRLYDTSGPWGDSAVLLDVTQGLSAMRAHWIRDRGDVEEYEGRVVRPIDDGYLSEKHAAIAAQRLTSNYASFREQAGRRPTLNS